MWKDSKLLDEKGKLWDNVKVGIKKRIEVGMMVRKNMNNSPFYQAGNTKQEPLKDKNENKKTEEKAEEKDGRLSDRRHYETMVLGGRNQRRERVFKACVERSKETCG